MNRLTLVVLKEKYCILKLKDKQADISWLSTAQWYSITKTEDELSIICPEIAAACNIEANIENGWSCFKIEGVLDFSLTGILAGILNVLADAKISILALSTFNTDYVLVKTKNLKKATKALTEADYIIKKQ